MVILVLVFSGAILLMCALTKISKYIWPDVKLTPWEEEEARDRMRD